VTAQYLNYGADHHLIEREFPADFCPVLLRPKAECRCDTCEASRYPLPAVESDGGETD
jgi:hypothetical protein